MLGHGSKFLLLAAFIFIGAMHYAGQDGMRIRRCKSAFYPIQMSGLICGPLQPNHRQIIGIEIPALEHIVTGGSRLWRILDEQAMNRVTEIHVIVKGLRAAYRHATGAHIA